MPDEREGPGAAATASGAEGVKAGAVTPLHSSDLDGDQIALPLDVDEATSAAPEPDSEVKAELELESGETVDGERQDETGERIRIFTLEELLRAKFPPRAMLLEPWLPEKGIAMIYAPRGVGKTHLALACGHAVASGGVFLHWRAPSPTQVLLIDGEMPIVTLQERLATIADNSDTDVAKGNLRLLSYDLLPNGGPDLSTEEGQAELEPYIGDAKLIIVDNISTLCRSGKENEAEGWAPIQAWALDQRRKGRTVLFVHHANKSGGQRGTSKREDVMDTVIMLSRPMDYRSEQGARFIVEFTKNRGFTGKDAESFEAVLSEGVWIAHSIKNDRTNRIMELHEEGLKQREIAARLGCSPATVNRTIKAETS